MSYLSALLESTRARIDAAKESFPTASLEQRIASREPPRDFAAALSQQEIAVIAEIKRASPSRGAFDLELDAAAAANTLAAAGVAALSVLTEPDFFAGRLEDVAAAAGAGLPVLRKDFILDDFQLLESRAAGADAVLLIARIVEPAQLSRLVAATKALGMHALVEVFSPSELDAAIDAGAGMIGVNHRDLETFEVDGGRTARLAPQVPAGCLLVALSGVSSRAEVAELERAGAVAVLVGEALATVADPAAKLRELRGA